MTEKEFEQYWLEHRTAILSQDGEYQDAKRNLGMRSGADWLLFALPAGVGILCVNNLPIASEILRWAGSAVATIVAFAGCVWVKSLLTGDRSLDEIEAELKERLRQQMIIR